MNNDFEYPILVGDRLRLRKYRIEDLGFFQRMLSDPKTMANLKFMANVERGGWTEEDILTRAQKRLTSARLGKSLNFSVTILETGELIGDAGLSCIDMVNRSAEFGRILHHPFHRKGFGAEIFFIVLDYAFDQLGLNRIEITTHSTNWATTKFYEKVGVPLEGVKREALIESDGAKDICVYGVIKSEWPRIKKSYLNFFSC